MPCFPATFAFGNMKDDPNTPSGTLQKLRKGRRKEEVEFTNTRYADTSGVNCDEKKEEDRFTETRNAGTCDVDSVEKQEDIANATWIGSWIRRRFNKCLQDNPHQFTVSTPTHGLLVSERVRGEPLMKKQKLQKSNQMQSQTMRHK